MKKMSLESRLTICEQIITKNSRSIKLLLMQVDNLSDIATGFNEIYNKLIEMDNKYGEITALVEKDMIMLKEVMGLLKDV